MEQGKLKLDIVEVQSFVTRVDCGSVLRGGDIDTRRRTCTCTQPGECPADYTVLPCIPIPPR